MASRPSILSEPVTLAVPENVSHGNTHSTDGVKRITQSNAATERQPTEGQHGRESGGDVTNNTNHAEQDDQDSKG